MSNISWLLIGVLLGIGISLFAIFIGIAIAESYKPIDDANY